MYLDITCQVTNEHRKTVEIQLTTSEIEELAVRKAKELDIKPRQGKLLSSFEERIVSVSTSEN